MTPTEFRKKWTDVPLKERSASQEHFIDLCRMLKHPTPVEADPEGTWFCFERGAEKVDGENGWADVWKREYFGWEYKGPHANLDAAYGQLLQYRESLENPPLLVVCDRDRIVIHTNFTNTVKRKHEVLLDNIEQPESLEVLRKLFNKPKDLRPDVTPELATEDAAAQVAGLAERLHQRGVPAREAAHFLMKLIFCLFAEDVGLLPEGLMTRILTKAGDDCKYLDEVLRDLFSAMRTGGRVLLEHIQHFDGRLFDDDKSVVLESEEVRLLADVARLDWGQVEPAVFGTLFERSLDPAKRAQLGTHYTSRADIEDIVEPVLMEPLRAEWERVKERCDKHASRIPRLKTRRGRTAARRRIEREIGDFMDQLAAIRVLDPACGSGNFLYVALAALKDLEKEVYQTASTWRAWSPLPRVDPTQLRGLEADPYAAELAHLTVWIGYLQWTRVNALYQRETPILKPLQNIQERDAILESDDAGCPSEPQWPEADVIIGNPPFLGGKKQRTELGEDYLDALFALYRNRVPHEADLCCYWFERARSEIMGGRAKRAGLLATNSIRHGRNRRVLDRILSDGGIFMAWADRPWILEGAAVRISMVGFDDGTQSEKTLDGKRVSAINRDLTSGCDLTQARTLKANAGLAFMGDTKGGSFDIPAPRAQDLFSRQNPLGRDNADVVRQWCSGWDVTRRPRGMWIIDFGVDMPRREAALYEKPFEYVRRHVLPERRHNRIRSHRERWWLHVRPRAAMRAGIAGLPRYVATARLAKHRLFVWLGSAVLPDAQLIVFPRDDDYFFGVLQSRVHERWALRIASSLEDRPRYTPTTCFETFPFPRPTAHQRKAIGSAAKRLHEVRPCALDAEPTLTMTMLYNQSPTWLTDLHRDLDEAVLAAYGWPSDIGDECLLQRLLALNRQQAADEARGHLVRP